MCIIIAAPVGQQIPVEHIENSAVNNPDWYGYSFVDFESRLQTKKFKPKEDIELLLSYEEDFYTFGYQSPFLMHFRIATQGAVNAKNCHPFKVNDNLVMAHNGMLNINVPKDLSKWSDTKYFIHERLKPLPSDLITHPAHLSTLGDAIGTSKFVFLDTNRELHFVNEHLGEYDAQTGIWYSNNTHKYSYYAKYTAYKYDEFNDYDDIDLSKTYPFSSLDSTEGLEPEYHDYWDWQQHGFCQYDKTIC